MGYRFVRSTRGTAVVSCLLFLSTLLLVTILCNMILRNAIREIRVTLRRLPLVTSVLEQLDEMSKTGVKNIIAILFLVMHICSYIALIATPLETPKQRLAIASACGLSCLLALLTIFNFWTFICVVLAAPLDIVIMCAMIANPSGRLNRRWIPFYLKSTPMHFGGAAETNQETAKDDGADVGPLSPLSARLRTSHPSAIASAPDLFDMSTQGTVIEI